MWGSHAVVLLQHLMLLHSHCSSYMSPQQTQPASAALASQLHPPKGLPSSLTLPLQPSSWWATCPRLVSGWGHEQANSRTHGSIDITGLLEAAISFMWVNCGDLVLHQNLKSHAVTMFEVGKLSDETLDSFLAELEKVRSTMKWRKNIFNV